MLLIGDSLGMVIQGHDCTLPVTLDADRVPRPHGRARLPEALIIADLPFGSYPGVSRAGLPNAARMMAAGAQVVKLEGGA